MLLSNAYHLLESISSNYLNVLLIFPLALLIYYLLGYLDSFLQDSGKYESFLYKSSTMVREIINSISHQIHA
jgi:hypothetical protein